MSAELVNSYFPMGFQTVGVCQEDWIGLVPKFRLLNGDFHLQEGIELIFAPGHTDGHQAVAVNTAKGRAIIFGDALYMYAGMAKRFPKQFLEVVKKGGVGGKPLDLEDPKVRTVVDKMFNARYGGYFGPAILNPGDIMRTLGKLDMMAEMVIPGHDAELLKMKVIPDDYTIE
jgi:hypothetical protein